MRGHGEKLTRKQDIAIASLLQAPNLAEAAKMTKISESTLWRWMKLDHFNKAYLQAKRESVRQAIAQIQQTCGDAIKTLREVMANSDAPASSRVAAARVVLEMAIKAVEFEDLEGRVAELEQIMREKR